MLKLLAAALGPGILIAVLALGGFALVDNQRGAPPVADVEPPVRDVVGGR